MEDEKKEKKKKENVSKNFVWKGHTQINVFACRLFGCYQKVISFCCYDSNSYRIFLLTEKNKYGFDWIRLYNSTFINF